MRHLPLIDPRPPRLSELGDALRRVEASGVFSNNGPEVRAFEAEATDQLFGGEGACLAVAPQAEREGEVQSEGNGVIAIHRLEDEGAAEVAREVI